MNTPKIHAWLNTIQNGTDEARKALNTMDGNYYLRPMAVLAEVEEGVTPLNRGVLAIVL